MIDFRNIVDFIFKNKNDYVKITADDKESNFFIINRKFARMYPKHAQFFNHKNIDKSTALDLWYYFFIKKRTIGIPDWYWKKSSSKKEKNNIKYNKDEIEFICKIHDLNLNDLNFLIKYYPDEIEEEINKYKKFHKKE
jgi:hypothetical protein